MVDLVQRSRHASDRIHVSRLILILEAASRVLVASLEAAMCSDATFARVARIALLLTKRYTPSECVTLLVGYRLFRNRIVSSGMKQIE